MICPFCGHKNISGEDECEVCFENLSSLDGVVPRTRIEKGLMEDPVSRLIERPKLVQVGPETSVRDAVQMMDGANVGCLLVMRDKGLVGILTERDILFKLLGRETDLGRIPVESVMTREPQTLSEEDSLAYAVNKMAVAGFRHIPIVRGGEAVGVISVRDVLKYLSKLFP